MACSLRDCSAIKPPIIIRGHGLKGCQPLTRAFTLYLCMQTCQDFFAAGQGNWAGHAYLGILLTRCQAEVILYGYPNVALSLDLSYLIFYLDIQAVSQQRERAIDATILQQSCLHCPQAHGPEMSLLLPLQRRSRRRSLAHQRSPAPEPGPALGVMDRPRIVSMSSKTLSLYYG